MAWFLYLIECRDGSIYTGIAVDVEKRYAAHAAGTGARYTRSHPPKKLLATLPYPDRSRASKAEYATKQLSAGEKRALARLAARSGRAGKAVKTKATNDVMTTATALVSLKPVPAIKSKAKQGGRRKVKHA